MYKSTGHVRTEAACSMLYQYPWGGATEEVSPARAREGEGGGGGDTEEIFHSIVSAAAYLWSELARGNYNSPLPNLDPGNLINKL